MIFLLPVLTTIILGNNTVTTHLYTLAEEKDDEDDNEDDEEPLKQKQPLPDIPNICPDLDSAQDISLGKYKKREITISEPMFKSLDISAEFVSLIKDFVYMCADSRGEHKRYTFEYHTKVSTIWKYNIYGSVGVGYAAMKECLNSGDDKGKKAAPPDYNAHLSSGIYINCDIGYAYPFNTKNNVICALHMGITQCTITDLKDQYAEDGPKTSLFPFWIGTVLEIETIFWKHISLGIEGQCLWLCNYKKVNDLKNYVLPDFGHTIKTFNLGFNTYIGYHISFEEPTVTLF